MARVTKSDLEHSIAILEIKLKKMGEKAVKLEQTSIKKDGVIVGKDNEILTLQRNINHIHEQRDKLVGFIEGRESLTNPTIEIVDHSYHQPSNMVVDRVGKFIEECTREFAR